MKTRAELEIHIPNSKHFELDEEVIKSLNEDEIRLIYSDLFAWTADKNWPVAKTLIPLLGRWGNLAAEHFMKVIESDDIDWLGSLMPEFLKKMPIENLKNIKPTLLRLINKPTEYEKDWAIDYAAKIIVNERLNGRYEL